MAGRTKFTVQKRDEFLGMVAEGHSITKSARAVGVSRRTIYDHRENDPAFATALEDAFIEGGELLEDEARRRAADGVTHEKPIYSRDGRLIDSIVTTEYSDTLLIFLLKGRFPEKYKDRVQQETSGNVTVKVVYGDDGTGTLGPPAAPALEAGGVPSE